MPKNPNSDADKVVQLYVINEGDKLAFYSSAGMPPKYTRLGEANLGSDVTGRVYEAARKKKLRFFL